VREGRDGAENLLRPPDEARLTVRVDGRAEILQTREAEAGRGIELLRGHPYHG